MNPVLLAERLVVAHHGRPPVLQEASLRIERGARVALLGANGAGKSTLLRTLVGLMHAKSGRVVLDGAEVGHDRASVRALRRRVQLVLQDPDDQLFSADVYQDVSYGPTNMGLDEAEVRARVEEALVLLGVDHLAERATHQLSYGERKRVATAGAVAMRPDVLMLDEPTAGLDPRGVDDVSRALARLHQHGATLVVATHDVDMALAWADEVAIVCDGQVVQGPSGVVLGDRELLDSAHLRLPFTVDVAHRMGLDATPRTVEELAGLLRRPLHEPVERDR